MKFSQSPDFASAGPLGVSSVLLAFEAAVPILRQESQFFFSIFLKIESAPLDSGGPPRRMGKCHGGFNMPGVIHLTGN